MTTKSNRKNISLTLNGEFLEVEVNVQDRLLDLIRGKLGLTGTKEGCGVGECGVCTIIMNGQAVNSCLIPALRADGAEITTVEGLSKGMENGLHPLQKTFLEHGAVQCGYCTPGMLLSSKAFLDKNKNTQISREMAKEAISGNLCRCTGYQKIIDAIMAYSQDSN